MVLLGAFTPRVIGVSLINGDGIIPEPQKYVE